MTPLDTVYFAYRLSMATNLTVSNEVIGRITISLFMFHAESKLDIDGETTVALPGTLKFTIQVDNYNFCSVGAGDCEGVSTRVGFVPSI